MVGDGWRLDSFEDSSVLSGEAHLIEFGMSFMISGGWPIKRERDGRGDDCGDCDDCLDS
jgi:hypothetical protein